MIRQQRRTHFIGRDQVPWLDLEFYHIVVARHHRLTFLTCKTSEIDTVYRMSLGGGVVVVVLVVE